jgi:hypothetical protein
MLTWGLHLPMPKVRFQTMRRAWLVLATSHGRVLWGAVQKDALQRIFMLLMADLLMRGKRSADFSGIQTR